MAKAKAQPVKKDETVKRSYTKTAVKPTPEPTDIEKTRTFTEVFASDAYASAEAFGATVEVVRVEEGDDGGAGTTVTVIYK